MTQRSGIPTASQVAGDVFSSFKRLNNIITKNDGIRSFSILTNNCYDSDQGFFEDQQTHIRITNSLHDINQISQTYLRMTFEANIRCLAPPYIHSATPKKHIPVLYFLGWKNANEVFKQIEVENMNCSTQYLQNEASKEGFCYSTYMPREEKMSKKFVHSRYEDVRQFKAGVCGVYFGWNSQDSHPYDTDHLAGDADNNTYEFTVKNIKIILPISDLLGFQCFEDFPSGLGDIVLKVFMNKDSMVWAQVDPIITGRENYFFSHEGGNDSLDPAILAQDPLKYDRRFFQVGETGTVITEYDNGDFTPGVQSISIKSLKCLRLQCECFGYNVTQECKKQLVSLFTPKMPYVIPAQMIDVKYFSNKIGTGPYDCDFTYALHNVTDFVIVFPKNAINCTTFMNPMAEMMQLRVDGKLYPNQAFESTYDHRFFTTMMNASDYQNFYEADDEYKNSFLIGRRTWVNQGAVTEDLCPTDMTSFIMTMQAERNSGGFFFDGLETGNQSVSISLRFNPQNNNPFKTECPPQVWFTRDVYWTVDNENGLKFWATGTPATYSSGEDWADSINSDTVQYRFTQRELSDMQKYKNYYNNRNNYPRNNATDETPEYRNNNY